jgi:hypothetical protein
LNESAHSRREVGIRSISHQVNIFNLLVALCAAQHSSARLLATTAVGLALMVFDAGWQQNLRQHFIPNRWPWGTVRSAAHRDDRRRKLSDVLIDDDGEA